LPAAGEIAARKLLLDPRPTNGIVVVAQRERPKRMEMIGKYNDAKKFERSVAANFPECGTQILRAEGESKMGRRFSATSVKKYVPPGTRQRR
jgi:hypothetical protein